MAATTEISIHTIMHMFTWWKYSLPRWIFTDLFNKSSTKFCLRENQVGRIRSCCYSND